ncbi:MAG: type IV pilus twitching motility protein PilT [Candidatus Buchananbacteria bacterium]
MELESLFPKSVELGASDLHLAAGLPPFFRIDGQLSEADKKIVTAEEIKSLITKLIDEPKLKKFTIEKELDFAYEAKNGARFRINLHFERGNMGLSARTIPTEIPAMEDIGMPDVVFDLCNMDGGLILVTGPTGCGKSTSLAAMIDYINHKRKLNIITLEDPIEFLFKADKSIIKQRQLGSDMLSFQNGLVHVLRQDPNVIMVGEMRDLDTIATTITLAETGHLVFATLHTYSASQTIDRIIDIFPPYQQNQVRMQISITLKGIIAQKLLPQESGGRVAAREILINNPAIANLIRENKISQIKTAIQTSARDGMISMDNALIKLYKEGVISKELLDQNITVQRSY